MKAGEKKRPKHGYLYLIQVRDSFPELHKIGITQNPPARFENLNDANAGNNRVLQVIYVAGYEKKESYLKDFFSNRAYDYKPLKGNGSTEVFHLTWLDLAIADTTMRWWALMDDWRAWLAWHLFVFSVCVYGLYWLFPWAFEYLINQI